MSTQNISTSPRIMLNINGKHVEALVDTAASRNLVKSKHVHGSTKHIEPVIFNLATRNRKLTIDQQGTIKAKLQGYTFESDALISDDITAEVVLGYPWLRQHQVVIDAAQGCIHVGTTHRHTVHFLKPQPKALTSITRTPRQRQTSAKTRPTRAHECLTAQTPITDTEVPKKVRQKNKHSAERGEMPKHSYVDGNDAPLRQRRPNIPRKPQQRQRLSRQKPYETVFVDIIGPLIESETGQRYVITIADMFSRWTKATTTRSVNAQSINDFLFSVFQTNGFPRTIVTKNGSPFTAKAWKDSLRRWNVMHSTTPNHRSEQAHTELEKVLKLHLQESRQPERWDEQLPHILSNLRCRSSNDSRSQTSRRFYGPKLCHNQAQRHPQRARKKPANPDTQRASLKHAKRQATDAHPPINQNIGHPDKRKHKTLCHMQAARSSERSGGPVRTTMSVKPARSAEEMVHLPQPGSSQETK